MVMAKLLTRQHNRSNGIGGNAKKGCTNTINGVRTWDRNEETKGHLSQLINSIIPPLLVHERRRGGITNSKPILGDSYKWLLSIRHHTYTED